MSGRAVRGAAAFVLSMLCPLPVAHALDLALPEWADQVGTREDPPGVYTLPDGLWDGRVVPLREVTGVRRREGWTFPLTSIPAGLREAMAEFAAQATDQGYSLWLDCAGAACGGFDFRRAVSLLPPPAMFLDLADFHVITAGREAAGTDEEAVMLILSRAGGLATLQTTRIAPAQGAAPMPVPGGDTEGLALTLPERPAGPVPRPGGRPATQEGGFPVPAPRPGDGAALLRAPAVVPNPPPTTDLAAALDAQGHAVLDDVRFPMGAVDLGPETPASLARLADYLADRPDLQAVIVGHSDASGAAAVNLEVSRARAQAVVARLREGYGIAGNRLRAEGVGYLAPRAPNATPEGRAMNRRVEVLMLPR